MMTSRPLFTLLRNHVPEVEISGEIVVHDGEKIVFQSSDAIGSYPARSVLKPFQFYATSLMEQGREFPLKYVAAMGSVSATELQVQMLKKWANESDNSSLISKMQLPNAYPMDEQYRARLKQASRSAEPLYHTCYAKHLAILESCRKHSWPLSTYLSQSHPYHQELVKALEMFLGESLKKNLWVTDGCQLPSPVLRLDQIALLFQRLFDERNSVELGAIREGMLAYPEWIGGPGRIDTRLMMENPGKLIGKEGADGLLAIAVKQTAQFPRGLGIVVKLAAGYLPQAAELALKPIFEKLGISSSGNIPTGQEIRYYYHNWEVKSPPLFDISPLINENSAVWPGDVTFSRKLALNISEGDHLTLSAIETTLHIGSHTDAPNHFDGTKGGIEQVDLERYQGLCQVIQIKRTPGAEITMEDLRNESLVAKRILFKTGSFPKPDRFNKDFMSISENLVHELSLKGVVLVGIDTPSVDAFDSKELGTHKSTLKNQIAILEGIDLSQVEPGVYDLIALPLKIEGADASPVRAILKGTLR